MRYRSQQVHELYRSVQMCLFRRFSDWTYRPSVPYPCLLLLLLIHRCGLHCAASNRVPIAAWVLVSGRCVVSAIPVPARYHVCSLSCMVARLCKKVTVKVEHLYSAPSRQCHRRGAQVHGVHQAASHIPALYLPSRSLYSFSDPEIMEGWVSPGPGRVQRATGPVLLYATARSQRDSNQRSRARAHRTGVNFCQSCNMVRIVQWWYEQSKVRKVQVP